MALIVKRHDGTTGRINRQTHDILFANACFRERFANALTQTIPPILRILFGPSRMRKISFVRRCGKGKRATRKIENASAD
jgi:hypothetical protein